MRRLRILLIAGLFSAAASCAHSPAQTRTPSALRDGMMVMDACTASQVLVVDNRTGTAVQVVASSGIPSSISSEELGTVQNNRLDTLRYVSSGRNVIAFNADRPPFPSGAPQKVTGLHAWCIPKG
jgi:hypothetical protein